MRLRAGLRQLGLEALTGLLLGRILGLEVAEPPLRAGNGGTDVCLHLSALLLQCSIQHLLYLTRVSHGAKECYAPRTLIAR